MNFYGCDVNYYNPGNPPIDEMLPQLDLDPAVEAYIVNIEDRRLKAQLFNAARKDPGIDIDEIIAMAEEVEPSLKGPEAAPYELIAIGNIRTDRLPPHVAEDFIDWVTKQLMAARIRGSKGRLKGVAVRRTGPDKPITTYMYRLPALTLDFRFEHGLHIVEAFGQELSQVVDWVLAENINYRSMTLDDAIEGSKDWHRVCMVGGEGLEYEEKNIVFEFPDGWTIQQIRSENDLEAEGGKMQHCVGSYFDDVQSGASQIFSLRDKKNQPHATIEGKPSNVRTPSGALAAQPWIEDPWIDAPADAKLEISQIQGKQNEEPIQRYKDRLNDWFKTDRRLLGSSDMIDTSQIAQDIFLWSAGKKALAPPAAGYDLFIEISDQDEQAILEYLHERITQASNEDFEAVTGEPWPDIPDDMDQDEQDAVWDTIHTLAGEALDQTWGEYLDLHRDRLRVERRW